MKIIKQETIHLGRWLKDTKFVNGIMQKGDDITHIIDEENGICQLNITFAGNVKNLQVEINKQN